MKLSFRIKKDIDLVFEYLTDMQKFQTVHPVISRIDDTGNESYLVHETLNLGFIPFSFTYPAIVEKNEYDNSVMIYATVFRITKIRMKFTLTPDQEYTVIHEQIGFDTKLPVQSILKKVFLKQHTQLFKNIELALE